MDREPFKMTDAGSRPEPDRPPVRLYALIYIVACLALLIGILLYAVNKDPLPIPNQ